MTKLRLTNTKLRLTNLSKVYWPKEGLTKGDLIDYYRNVTPFILPHLKDRPESLHRYPDGIDGESFYQKDVKGKVPNWVPTVTIPSEHSRRGTVTYILCQDQDTLLYLANLGCIEINCWNSRVDTLDEPDYAVIDLDPTGVSFHAVIKVAQAVKTLLDEIGAEGFCKTSGASGLHIFIPLAPLYSYEQVRLFTEAFVTCVLMRTPSLSSMERMPSKRGKRVYLDYMQNNRGQTMAATYSVRPRPKAPVSTPLTWPEVNEQLDPTAFNIRTILTRLEKKGDLWARLSDVETDLEACSRRLAALLERQSA